ncbi:MAG: hypothetical protein OEY56_00025 [Cyclobacteriaceae bacterium]|nr:hypothetical protein [Cyclobacteriaceae bacterium]
MSGKQEIYFHVGLGKVASTYLQHRFFPKLEGIHYIPTSQYKKSKKIIPGIKAAKVLVSREFDRQFEREVRWFTDSYPDARIIVIFRPHDGWIASQYRRYVKNGWHWDFARFFDLEKDTGFWKKDDLLFYPKLELIEACSGQKPLVLFYEELRKEPWDFLNKMASYMGAGFDPASVSLRPFHRSYSEKQLKVLRTFCRNYKQDVPKGYSNKLAHWLLYRPWWAFFHLIMYAASFFPAHWVGQEPLIDPDYLDKIRTAYLADWEKVKMYAQTHNPS